EAILALQETCEQELQQLEGGEESITVLRQEVDTAADAAWAQARELSLTRRAAAQTLEARMSKELAALGMRGATSTCAFRKRG
ncbi:MAG TPA: DNA repair protein RecN, partial [Candidatus Binatia bacterium]|nr:DNA repair protein RecN [Candidatus Binatia bacterium]